jgi:hypothetical protein
LEVVEHAGKIDLARLPGLAYQPALLERTVECCNQIATDCGHRHAGSADFAQFK